MTKDQIIKLAREAGFNTSNRFSQLIVRHSNGSWVDVADELERFAALVAAAEREACAVAATKLRRLHAENKALRQALEAIVIGYGEPDIPEAALVKARAAIARAGELK